MSSALKLSVDKSRTHHITTRAGQLPHDLAGSEDVPE